MSLRHTWFYASQLHLVQTPVDLLVTPPVLLGAGNGTLAGTQAPIAIAQTAQDGKIVGIALLLACDGEAVLLEEHVIHMNKLPQNQGFHFVACCWVCQRHIICVGCGASCLAAGAQVMGLPLRDFGHIALPPSFPADDKLSVAAPVLDATKTHRALHNSHWCFGCLAWWTLEYLNSRGAATATDGNDPACCRCLIIHQRSGLVSDSFRVTDPSIVEPHFVLAHLAAYQAVGQSLAAPNAFVSHDGRALRIGDIGLVPAELPT